ncbi:MAG: UvrB/UvrC motif-containing protein [Verrucomicrobia bacterium]|nr:UvrB/UvrC motif-containing protein [Verrucomicrobiota bacterium]
MNFDISHILEQWDYQSGQVIVRKFKGKDGVERLQLRVDLGLLQMNAQGRPDGKHPFGHESLFEHYQQQLEKHRAAHEGSDEGFQLKIEDCSKLQQEAIQYHHRYICLFQLEDYDAVLRDTDRNLRVFNFVQQYAASEDLSWAMQQFRPQLMLMRIRAQGTMALKRDDFDGALKAIEEATEELRNFYRESGRTELADNSPEIHSLEMWQQDLQEKRPLSEREQLEIELDEAVQNEDYEKAAQVRDALRKIKTT